MRIGHADLRIGPHAAFAPHHHRDDARQVGLERDDLQVEHQLDVVGVEHRDAGRLVDGRIEPGQILLRLLDAPLDLADRREIFVELPLVGRPEILRQLRGPLAARDRGCCGGDEAGARASRAAGWCRGRRRGARTRGADSSRAASASPGRATRGCWCTRRSIRSRSCRPCASRRSPARATRSASAAPGAAPRSDRPRCRSGCRRPPSCAGARRSGTTRRRGRGRRGRRRGRCRCWCARPESTSVSSRNASSGLSTRENSKPAPSPVGVQSAIVMPFGT